MPGKRNVRLSNDLTDGIVGENLGTSPKKKQRTLEPETGSTSPLLCKPKTKLEDIMAMPVDIFLEICSFLHPRDLLNLARCTKRLRFILMSKSSLGTWENSLQNVHDLPGFRFPKCPPDSSHPEYASLVFDTYCMICETGFAQVYDLAHRKRICRGCRGRLPHSAQNNNLLDFIHACEPRVGVPVEISDIFDIIPVTFFEGRFCPGYARFLFEKCMKRKARLSPSGYAEYLRTQKEMRAAVANHGLALECWYVKDQKDPNGSVQIKRREDRELLNAQRKDIAARLRLEGWFKKDMPKHGTDFYDAWKDLMTNGKRIKEQSWPTVRNDFVILLQNERSRRLSLINSAPLD